MAKKSRINRGTVLGLVALIVFVAAVVLAVLDATTMQTAAVHPLLFLAGVLLVGEGLVFFIFGTIYKLGGTALGGGLGLTAGALYFCLDFITPINIPLTIIVPLGVLVITVAICFIFSFKGAGIEFDNDSPTYKTYKEKKRDGEI